MARHRLGHDAATEADEVPTRQREGNMPESIYKFIEMDGTSTKSWEKAASAAVN